MKCLLKIKYLKFSNAEIMLNISFSVVLYLCCTSDKDRLKYCTGLSFGTMPCDNIAATALSDASHVIMNVSEYDGCIKTGGDINACFNSLKDFPHLFDQMYGVSFLKRSNKLLAI